MAKSEILDKMCKCSGKIELINEIHLFIGFYVPREDTPAHEFKKEQKQLIRSFEELAVHCDFSLLQVHFI